MASSAVAIPVTHAELRREVDAVLLAGPEAIEVAWVRTYHETGRLIYEHLLLQENRAAYGCRHPSGSRPIRR